MELYAYRCDRCGKLHHPSPRVCRCGGRTFTPEVLAGSCTLVTWTRVYALPVGYDEPCRTYGVARFPGGLTVTGVLDVDQPVDGMALTAEVGIVRTTGPAPQYGFRFRNAD